MKITSELKFTDITDSVKNHGYNPVYQKSNHIVVAEKGFTEHIHCTKTRYSDAFWFYNTDSIIGASLYYYGEYTEQEIMLLRNFMNSEYVVYDVGANIGVHTVAFAKQNKHVYAFEPNVLNYRLLKMNSIADNNITLIDKAVGKTAGTAKIEEFSLTKMGNFGECKISDTGQDCDMVSIDELVKTKQILPPNIVKIDVEGYEWEVLQGMDDTIRNNLPVIFYEALTADLSSIYNYLNGLAYTLYWFPCNNYNPHNFRNNKENIFGHGGVLNILAIPFHLNVNTNLPKVLDADDTWEKAVQRLQAQQNVQ
jgi:FkbM family methyltransferase